jgi:hypothetical protein
MRAAVGPLLPLFGILDLTKEVLLAGFGGLRVGEGALVDGLLLDVGLVVQRGISNGLGRFVVSLLRGLQTLQRDGVRQGGLLLSGHVDD